MPTSLISIVAAMALVAIMAVMAEPSLSATERTRHDAIVTHVEYLIELARDRSTTTDIAHGVRWDLSTRTFSVVEADLSVFPVVILRTTTDPTTKQPAQLVIPTGMTMSPDDPFRFSTIGSQTTVFFDNWGTPVNVSTGGNFQQLLDADLNFTADGWTGWLNLRAVSGRVTTSVI